MISQVCCNNPILQCMNTPVLNTWVASATWMVCERGDEYEVCGLRLQCTSRQ